MSNVFEEAKLIAKLREAEHRAERLKAENQVLREWPIDYRGNAKAGAGPATVTTAGPPKYDAKGLEHQVCAHVNAITKASHENPLMVVGVPHAIVSEVRARILEQGTASATAKAKAVERGPRVYCQGDWVD